MIKRERTVLTTWTWLGKGDGVGVIQQMPGQLSVRLVRVLTDCWGIRQNTSVETGDFLQKNIKCMLVEFCRSVTPSPHVRVKSHLGDDSQLLLYYNL